MNTSLYHYTVRILPNPTKALDFYIAHISYLFLLIQVHVFYHLHNRISRPKMLTIIYIHLIVMLSSCPIRVRGMVANGLGLGVSYTAPKWVWRSQTYYHFSCILYLVILTYNVASLTSQGVSTTPLINMIRKS